MSSTERIRRFFEDQLLPAAERARRERGDLFPTRPDPQAETYWQQRPKRRMEPQDFELPVTESTESLARALAEYWSRGGRPELAALAPALADLAGELRTTEEQVEDVSPFLYVMF